MSDIEVRENLSDPQAEKAQQDSAPQTYEGVDSDGKKPLNPVVVDTTSDSERLAMIERSKVHISPADATTESPTNPATGPFDTSKHWDSGSTTQGDTWEYPKPANTSDATGGLGPNPYKDNPIDDQE